MIMMKNYKVKQSSSPSGDSGDDTSNQGKDGDAPNTNTNNNNKSHHATKSSFIDDEKTQRTSDGAIPTAAPLPLPSMASGQSLSSSTTTTAAHPHPVASLTGGATAPLQQESGALPLPIATQIAMISYLLPQAQAQTGLPLALALAPFQPAQAQPTTMPSSQQAYQNQFQMQLASQLALALSQQQYQPQTASAPSQPSLTALALVQASQQRSLQPTSQTAIVNAFLQQLNNYQTYMQQQQQQYQPPPPQEQTRLQLQLHQQYQQLQQSLQARTNLSSPQDNQSHQLQRMVNENMLLTQLLQPSTSVASSNFLSQAVQMQQQHLNQLHHIQRQQAGPTMRQLQDHTASSKSSPSASASELASQGDLHINNPNQSTKKRWMMRYEELRQFQQVSGCCLCKNE